MEIGVVKWYGNYNSKTDRYNEYGFLTPVTGNEDLFFHKNGIDPLYRENAEVIFTEGSPVVYEEQEGRKPGKKEAVQVRPLSVLEQSEKEPLYRQCKERDVGITRLAGLFPEHLGQEELDFFLPYLKDLNDRGMEELRTAFLERCKAAEPQTIWDTLGDGMLDESVLKLFAKEIPAVFDCKGPDFFLPFLKSSVDWRVMYSLYTSGEMNAVLTVFLERCKTVEPETLWDILGDKMLDKSVLNLFAKELPAVFDCKGPDFFLPYLEELDDWGMQALRAVFLDCCKAAGPAALWDILGDKMLDKDLLSFFTAYIPAVFDKKELDFFLPYLDIVGMSSLFWKRCEVIGSAAMLDTLGDRLLETPFHSPLLNGKRLAWIFSEMDWQDTGEENLDRYRRLFSYIEADEVPDAVVSLAETMRNHVSQLPSWWPLFQDSVKVRILIYFSNFGAVQANRDAWFMPLREIFQWEQQNRNLLLTAVLKFFVNIYSTNAAQHQKNFFEAHNALMTYITECFTAGTDVTHGLRTLLEPCRNSDNNGGRRYVFSPFCDVRIWNNAETVYCPQLRKPCGKFSMDLTRTTFRRGLEQGKAEYHKQVMMDLLLNTGGIPDLRTIDIGERTEYPFRISAFVNGLRRMRQHMKCSLCGELFHPVFLYAKLKTAKLAATVFSCSKLEEQPADHDSSVYLNFCWHCHQIIDSRECQFREKDWEPSGIVYHVRKEEGRGQYLCMHCGGAEHTPHGTVCPRCGSRIPGDPAKRVTGRVICKQCHYDSAQFVSEFEREL